MRRRRAATGLVVVAIVLAFIATLNQPWLEQWGSTPEEQAEVFPGDGIVSDASSVYTRSVSIAAPPTHVWPWLVQMGQDKAGFYSFDWAETLFTDPMRNASAVNPEWQQLAVGDFMHPFPPERGLASWRVRQLDPQRFLLVATDDGTWSLAFDLRPMPGDQTRLVTRFRSAPNWMNVVLGPADLIVFPRLLVGLQQRAEATLPGMPGVPTGAPLPTARLPVQWWAAGLWLAGLMAVGGALAPVLRVGDWRRPRPHPGITIGIAFVGGAGYAIMSDTPPSQFLVRNWMLGLPLAVLVALVASPRTIDTSSSWAGRVGRAVVAVAEVGLFVVVPATAVWQAATARGWADGVAGRVAVSLLAMIAALLVAGAIDTRRADPPRRRLPLLTVMAGGYVLTGSALVPLLGVALLELLPPGARPQPTEPAGVATEATASPPLVPIDQPADAGREVLR